jgi:predicted RNA-binding protein YlxR (DUF448 family)
MSKRTRRRKHVPQRICVACRIAHPKRELIRIVHTPEGTVTIDETGKQKGRGAYLCRQRVCWETALTHRQLERALKATIAAETMAQLREYAATLPQSLVGKPEESQETVG